MTSSLACKSWASGPKNKGHKAPQAQERSRLRVAVPQGTTAAAQLSPGGAVPSSPPPRPGAEPWSPSAVRQSQDGAGKGEGGAAVERLLLAHRRPLRALT